jgi:hypothetical protein
MEPSELGAELAPVTAQRFGRLRSRQAVGSHVAVSRAARAKGERAHREPSRDNQRREHAASCLGMRCPVHP